jgi:ABC-type uncharacterized transport system substrate-binding protein
MSVSLTRRTFGFLLGAALGSLGLDTRAQSSARKRVGLLLGTRRNPTSEAYVEVFRRTLASIGWEEGRNLMFDVRWGEGSLEKVRAAATELLALKPDVIFANGIRALNEGRAADITIPIVFIATTDPVAHGFAQSLARPGGQTTGFLLFEFSVLGKLLDGLHELAPNVKRVALLINPDNRSTGLHAEAFAAAARTMGFEPSVLRVREYDQLVQAMVNFGTGGSGGIILPPDVFMVDHRDGIAATALRIGVPLVAAQREFVEVGALASYGVNERTLNRQAASYVDRILRGTRAGDLPIQAPTDFQFVINPATAKALNLAIPPTLVARADEVIE